MSVRLLTAGVTVEVVTAAGSSGRWRNLVREACAGHELDEGGPSSTAPGSPLADVFVTVTQRSDLGPSERHHLVTRGAWADGREVILHDACSSGIDLMVRPLGDRLEVVARPRPGWRHRGLGLAAPDRQVLLHRAVLLQDPALWWSGVLGNVPLHVSAATVDGFGRPP